MAIPIALPAKHCRLERLSYFGYGTIMEQSTQTARPAAAGEGAAAAKVTVQKTGALVTISLNRPEALNAFDDEMCQFIGAEIPRIARNPDVYIVALKSTSAKAFCAGGDVKALTRLARSDLDSAKGYFHREYSLDWLLECFSKPTVSFINGICMGSGAGLTAFNTHRIAGENFKWAMPETAIGLFPDVGVAHLLARMPWPLGLYLGLTGRTVGQADSKWLGIATHTISTTRQAQIAERLADGYPVDPMLDGLDETLARGRHWDENDDVVKYFSGDSLAEIVDGLARSASPWAASVLSELRKKSPISLAITDRHIRSARGLDLREVLRQDYRLAVRCLEGNDFCEGVRAVLVDKDNAPRWQPAHIEDVTEAMIAGYFASLGAGELGLPGRAEMQAARV